MRGFVFLPTILCAGAILCAGSLQAQEASGDAAELRRLHEELLVAHRTADMDRWMAIEAAAYVSANGGRVTQPELEARRTGRAAYLAGTTFAVYRDLREPLVRVSEDGSLGWLIAEVEVRGSTESVTGGVESFHDIWAWVELYEKVDGRWYLVGNASNRRPGEGG
jgi:hypothetical protein